MKLMQILLACLVMMIAPSAFALAQAWKMIPEGSRIVFIATQNGAPVQGRFTKIKGNINFDPAQLSESKVVIIVDINSITTNYDDLTSTLKTPDWFNVKIFPEAVFTSTAFTKTGDNQYRAEGTLAIRDKSIPVTLNFTFQEPTANTAVVNGSTTLKRNAFGVGQGEWSSVEEVQDNVKVNFTVKAEKS